MKKVFKELKNQINLVKLTASEKAEMRLAVLDFIKQNPLQKSVGFFAMFKISRYSLAATFTITALVVVSTTGISLAAEQSLPGDILYSLKVNVNEKLRDALTVSGQAKADWETQKVERRLEELENLKVENRLSEQAKQSLQQAIDQQTQKASDISNKLSNQEKTIAAHSRLEAVLNSHSQVLLNLIDENSEEDIVSDVAKKSRKAAENRKQAEEKFAKQESSQLENAATGKLLVAENKIIELEKFIENKSPRLKQEAQEKIQENLDKAKQALQAGKDYLEAGQYSDAFVKFQEAIRLAQETQILTSVSGRLKIEFKSNRSENSQEKNGVGDEDKRDSDISEIKDDQLESKHDEGEDRFEIEIQRNSSGRNR